jgi:hypothetical protein
MAAKLSPELLLAKALAAPFTPPAREQTRGQHDPLSCRSLPDGGMVVVAADGRKLWFSPAEVADARVRLEDQKIQEEKLVSAAQKRVPIRLVAPLPDPPRQNNGIPLRAVIQEDQLKK